MWPSVSRGCDLPPVRFGSFGGVIIPLGFSPTHITQMNEHFSFMYADLCRKITDNWSTGTEGALVE